MLQKSLTSLDFTLSDSATGKNYADTLLPSLSPCLTLWLLLIFSRYIQSTCATSGEGLYEGLDWLSNNIANKAQRTAESDGFLRLFHGCIWWQSIDVTAIIFIITGVLDFNFLFYYCGQSIDAIPSVIFGILSYVLSVCGAFFFFFTYLLCRWLTFVSLYGPNKSHSLFYYWFAALFIQFHILEDYFYSLLFHILCLFCK